MIRFKYFKKQKGSFMKSEIPKNKSIKYNFDNNFDNNVKYYFYDTHKIIFVFFIFLASFFLFSFDDITTSNNKTSSNDESLILLNTTREIIYKDYSFTLSDIDLTLKLILQDKNFNFGKTRYELLAFFNKYVDLFNIQLAGLKSFTIDFIKENKLNYIYKQDSLNQYYYYKKLIEILLYDENYIVEKRFLCFSNLFEESNENNLKLLKYKFCDSPENYLYFISKMFRINQDINNTYDNYKNELNQKIEELKFNELLLFFINNFNIKDKKLKIVIDIVPVIYKYNDKLDKDLACRNEINKEMANFKIDCFDEDLIYGKNYLNYIAISLSLFKDRFNLARLFFKTLFYQFLNQIYLAKGINSIYGDYKSDNNTNNNINNNENNTDIAENNNEKDNVDNSGYKDQKNSYFEIYLINKIDDPSKLNSFFSSLKNLNFENLKDFYSEFVSFYLIKKLETKEKDLYDNIFSFLKSSYENKINYEFYLFLINKYNNFCEKNKIVSSFKFFDEKEDNLKLFYKFIIDEIYKNKEKIIKKIIDISKFLISIETTQENEFN